MNVNLSNGFRCLLWVFLGVFVASGVHAQSVTLSAVNNSLCFWSDTDNDQSSPVAYDPAIPECVENTGLNDLNVFRVASTTSGNGTSAVVFNIDAGIAVDANSFSISVLYSPLSALGYTIFVSQLSNVPSIFLAIIALVCK